MHGRGEASEVGGVLCRWGFPKAWGYDGAGDFRWGGEVVGSLRGNSLPTLPWIEDWVAEMFSEEARINVISALQNSRE